MAGSAGPQVVEAVSVAHHQAEVVEVLADLPEEAVAVAVESAEEDKNILLVA